MMMWSDIDARIVKLKKAIKRRRLKDIKKLKVNVFKFRPFSGKQKKVLTWWCDNSPVKNKDGIIADGAIRSGKTLCMSLSFVMWAMYQFSDQNFAVCGKTIGSLRRNVIFWLKLMLRARGYRVKEHRTDNLIVIQRADRINYFYMFGGKDERSQDLIQGITLAGVLFDEVALMPESFVNQATARCSVAGSKFWFNCNPQGPGHWFKTEWIDKRIEKGLLYLHFIMDDNLSLDEDIKKRYRSQWSGLFYKRFILGLWVLAEGLVYTMFDPEKHVVKDVPGGGLYYISVDYGTVNPFSAGLWCVQNRVGTRVKEYYYDSKKATRQKTDEEYYSEIEKLAIGHVIQGLVIDPSAASFIECVHRHGKFSVYHANNSVLDGIRNTASMIEVGMLKFHESCKDTIREFGLYSWDTEKTEDAVIKEYDHAMDDTRYFVQTIMRRNNRGYDWRAKRVS